MLWAPDSGGEHRRWPTVPGSAGLEGSGGKEPCMGGLVLYNEVYVLYKLRLAALENRVGPMTSTPDDPTFPELRSSRRRSIGLIGGVAALAGGGAVALLAATASPGGATATLTVDTLTDGAADAADCTTPVANSCSLRDALAAAADGDIIAFATGLTGTITLDSGQGALNIGHALTISGPGASSVTIDGATYSSIFSIAPSIVGDVSISGLTVQNAINSAISVGNSGDLTLSDLVLKDNSGGSGGALYIGSNVQDVAIDSSTLTGNTVGNGSGGAISARNAGDLTVRQSTLTGNEARNGGAIFAHNYGNVVIDGSYIADNAAVSLGGGLVARYGPVDVNITDSEIYSNNARLFGGFAVLGNTGATNINRSTFLYNDSVGRGGALYLAVGAGGVTISNSTMAANSSNEMGGAIFAAGAATIAFNQSTITQNQALAEGGAIAAGINSSYPLTISVIGSIISGNSANSYPYDISNPYGTISIDHSVYYSGGITGTVTDLGGNVDTEDPMVDDPAFNGGSVRTMALQVGSPAIDAGPDPVPVFPGNAFDERGEPWVRIYNGVADIGAFEVQPDPAAVLTYTGLTTLPQGTTSTSLTAEVGPAWCRDGQLEIRVDGALVATLAPDPGTGAVSTPFVISGSPASFSVEITLIESVCAVDPLQTTVLIGTPPTSSTTVTTTATTGDDPVVPEFTG